MNEAYLARSLELFSEAEKTTSDENFDSPQRNERIAVRNNELNLTPTQGRSPLQTLQESPEGYLYRAHNANN